LGYAAALYGLPTLFLGPLVGTLADHTSPVKFLFISFTFRFIVAFLLFGVNSESAFLTLVCLKGISNLGSGAAEIILTRKLLTNKELVSNISLITVMDQSIKICSPLAGGIIVSMSDKAYGFLISAFFSLLGIFCVILLSMNNRKKKINESEKRSFGSAKALKVLFSTGPSTQLFFICALFQSAVLGCYDSLLSLHIKNIGLDAYAFGVIVSATALGGIIAGLSFKLVYPQRMFFCSTLSLLAFGAMVATAGLLTEPSNLITLAILILVFSIAGYAYGLTSLAFGVTLQKYCPLANLGTVSATARSLMLIFMITGPIFGAWLSTFISIGSVLVVSGVSAIICGALLHIKYRNVFSSETIRIYNEQNGSRNNSP
jgi:MFS family permease